MSDHARGGFAGDPATARSEAVATGAGCCG
jgi:hypothetical protein